jgi:hypothetical protein
MNYAAYFLTVYDIVRFARSQNPLPGPRIGSQFHHLLLPGHYIGGSHQI